MSSEEATVAPEEGYTGPEIGPNLFWDDVRIGMGMLVNGLFLLLLGAVIGPAILPVLLYALLVLIGGIFTVLGLKVCASIPSESGVSQYALGAFVCGALCFVTAIVNWFMSWSQPVLVGATVVLGAASAVMFTIVFAGCARFLHHHWLTLLTTQFVIVAAFYSFLFILFVMTPLRENIAIELVALVLTAVVSVFAMYLASMTKTALTRAQQGLPVEGKLAATEAMAAAAGESGVSTEKGPQLEHVEPPSPEAPLFTESEVKGFQTDDGSAGKAIVGLMTGVFSVGVILYTIIAVLATSQ